MTDFSWRECWNKSRCGCRIGVCRVLTGGSFPRKTWERPTPGSPTSHSYCAPRFPVRRNSAALHRRPTQTIQHYPPGPLCVGRQLHALIVTTVLRGNACLTAPRWSSDHAGPVGDSNIGMGCKDQKQALASIRASCLTCRWGPPQSGGTDTPTEDRGSDQSSARRAPTSRISRLLPYVGGKPHPPGANATHATRD